MRSFVVVFGVVVLLAVLLAPWLPSLLMHGSAPSAAGTGTVVPATTNEANAATDARPAAATGDDREAASRTVVTSAEAPLHGTVVGPGGEPVAGARVVAESSDVDEYSLLDRARRAQRRVVAAADTDAAGAFAFVVPPGRHHLVRVTAAGFAPAARGGCQAGARVDFQLAFAATLAGSVRDEAGLPVPDTRIVVRQAVALGALGVGETTTDARGEFTIGGLPPGEVQVDVLPTTLATPRDADVALVAGATVRHDVVLLAGMTIRGTVRDATTRAGIADAEVGEGIAGRVVRTGADGAFTLVGFAARHNVALRVHADGYPDREVVIRLRGQGPEGTLREVEVLLARGFTARGRVVDTTGRPLADVYVAGTAADHRGDNEQFRSDWRSTTTAADGTFVIAPLRADMAHELLVLRAGFATAVFAFPAPSEPGGDVDLGDVVLQPPASLRGRVVDERGEGVAGHAVELAGHNADRWRFAPKPDEYRALDGYVAERHARTDDRGRFHFTDLAAGDYVVRAMKFDSHEPAQVEVAVAAAADVQDVELQLFRGLTIAGQVFASDGGKLPKVYCSIDPEDGQGTSGDVEVTGDGRFRASGLAPGNYKVTAYPYGSDSDTAAGRIFNSHELSHVAAGSLAVRIEIQVHGWVAGTVVDAAQAPRADAIVLVRDGERIVDWTGTDAMGHFQIASPVQRPLRVFVLPRAPEPGAAIDVTTALVTADTQAGAPPLMLVLPGR